MCLLIHVYLSLSLAEIFQILVLAMLSSVLTCVASRDFEMQQRVEHDPCQQAAPDQFVPLRNAEQRALREATKGKKKKNPAPKTASKSTLKAEGEAKAKAKATKKNATEKELTEKEAPEKQKSAQLVSKEDQARYKALLGFHDCGCSSVSSLFVPLLCPCWSERYMQKKCVY